MTDTENNIETPATETPEFSESPESPGTPEVPEVHENAVIETQETMPEVSQEVEKTEEPEGEEPKTRAGMNWFVLRVASNKEDYVKAALDRKVEIEAMQHLVGRIMVPTEKTKTLSKTGKAKITETKLYPGYIFVEMKLEEQRISQDIFFLIKETTGVGDFVGTA
ncbi:MAG TPA: transcription termination/antitermination NusG family protein, partial [Phycisphaerales bacterium]|nr:transcription termination/antitermination NusG family protein [Phycisphaerales bacterium]